MSQSNFEARLSQVIAEAEKELGWKLSSARPYVGIQTEAKHATIGSHLPHATDNDLQKWKDFFRGKGWTEEEIAKAGYTKGASAYIKLDAK